MHFLTEVAFCLLFFKLALILLSSLRRDLQWLRLYVLFPSISCSNQYLLMFGWLKIW